MQNTSFIADVKQSFIQTDLVFYSGACWKDRFDKGKTCLIVHFHEVHIWYVLLLRGTQV
jgi:hypothetical protein